MAFEPELKGSPLYFLPFFSPRRARPDSAISRRLASEASPHRHWQRFRARKVFVHDVEELLKLEGRTAGKYRDQVLGYQIRNSAGKREILRIAIGRQL